MAHIYKFRVETDELEKELWREFEISDNATVATFAYAVLAMFYAEGSHLFAVHCNGCDYLLKDTLDFNADFIPPLEGSDKSYNVNSKKLSELNLKVGSVLNVEYDFGTTWEWKAKLKSIAEMEKGSGRKYPRVTEGKGSCMIEDVAPFVIADMIEESKKTGILPRPYSAYADEDDEDAMEEWDYTDFDAADLNTRLKDDIEYLRDIYEADH